MCIRDSYKGVNNAANKAKTDIEYIMEQCGYRNVGLKQTRYTNAVIAFILTLSGVLKSVFCLHKGDVLILQYPLKKYYTFVCCMAHLRGCKIITLIHDLDSFRRRRLTIPHEISRLNHSDSIIVHSERMKNWLHENGIKANLEVLGVFDYLSDRQSSGKNLAASHPRVLFVGALSTFHSDFLYKLGRSPRSFDMVLYGNGFEPDKFEGQVDHKGYTRSDDLIATAEGEYGLVWYGSSLEGGVGPEGEYLQYNAPHKLSLYIRCGLPVIIWKKAALASFVEENVISEEVNGKKVFKGWKAPGEPWVRYYGLPTEVEAGLADQHPEYVDYFDKAGKLWKVSDKDGNGETTYYPYSPLNQYMFDKKVIIDYPVAPGAPKVQITDLYAWYGLYLSTAEVNLYLAELKLLSQGQDIGFSGSAESYLKKGVEYSMRAYDKLAGLNHIPYYDNTFGQDKFDVTIKLQENEVTRLLNDPILTLDGSTTENLEKVYLQQYIHFIFFPADQYIMMRRSGCPMKESDLYPMLNLNPKVSNYPLPRRFQVTQPTVDDKMGDIKRKAYQDQGYSYGPEPTILNTERVWYDKKAPQFGEGPNLN